jgi:hypothetical protein
VLKAKSSPVEADPDVIDSTWRTRPERILTAEQLIRQQFANNPKQLAKELARKGENDWTLRPKTQH